MSIEILVCDLGQVLLPFDFSPRARFLRERSRAPEERTAADLAHIVQSLHERLGFGIGGCTGEEFYAQVMAHLNMDLTYEEFCREYSNYFREDHAVVDLVGRTRVQHRFLLSNTDVIHWEWIQRHHPSVLEIFDRCLVSQELKMLKPHPEIYRKVEELTGVPSSAHLLIDDLKVNVDGARGCGWDGIVYTDADALERELRARHLLD